VKDLLDNLRAFNSKERFFLVGEVLGNRNFTPTEEFRQKLGNELGGMSIPADAFSAMDFHIDWLYASLKLAKDGEPLEPYSSKHEGHQVIKGQQEDIDWIIAFRDGKKHHIILIEAKGVTGWTNKQMDSKAKRFKAIFGKTGDNWPDIEAHFLMMSPERPPKELVNDEWPNWMNPGGRIHWLQLKVAKGLKSVVRCNGDRKKDSSGEFWKTAPRGSGDEE
jgi:hypothetical protein